MNSGPPKVLLVEDSQEDVVLMKKAIQECGMPAEVANVECGKEAMDFLSKHKDRPPKVVILDLNLPRIDGMKTLSFIKTDPDLKSIPVIVFTTSNSETDIQQSYSLHANCYIQKPVSAKGFREIFSRIKEFWFDTAALPSSH